MPLTDFDIARIASLARLELAPAQREAMLTQINDFFAVVEKMRAVDTQGVQPLAHPVAAVHEQALRLQPDVVTETNQRAANQQNAPAVERGLFLVPRVIE